MASQIVFVEGASRMGGVQFSTLYLASHLDRQIFDPMILLPGPGEFSQACQEAGVPVEILPMPELHSTSFRIGRDLRIPNPAAWIINLMLLLVGALRLVRFLRCVNPDLVLTKSLSAHFYGGVASKILGLPCLWHVQDFISERFLGLFRWGFNLAAWALADRIVVDGTPIAAQLWAGLQSRVRVVFNGVDIALFSPRISGEGVRQELGFPNGGFLLGNVARITPWKGQDHLLRAFGELCSDLDSACLVLVGSPVFASDAFYQQLTRQRDSMACAERVILAGYRRDLPEVLSAMDLFVYTAVEKDTCPLSLLSAMACGLPVVAFDLPGIREVVQEAGILVPVGDDAALARAIRSLYESPGRRKALAEAAREKAITRFSLTAYVHNMQLAVLDAMDDGGAA